MLRRVSFGLLWFCMSVHGQTSVQQVERLIRILSADSLQGRGNFNGGLQKAAAFIENELRSYGLKPLDVNGYQRPFSVFRVSCPDIKIRLNGQAITSSNRIVQSSSETITIDKPVEPVIIGAEDDFFASLGPILDRQGITVVLVDPQHEKLFQYARRFLERESIYLQADGTVNRFFLLTPVSSIKTLSITSNNVIQKVDLVNVVGVTPGQSDEQVFFSAHMDHIGILKAVEGDSIANGADDDASGVSAVLCLAKQLSGTKPKRTLVFAFFAGEELGMLGSQYLATQLDPNRIIAMVNLEMLGKPSTFGRGHGFMTGYDRSTLGDILNEAICEPRIHPDPYPQEDLFLRSDNASFARLGVPAHTISVTPIDVDTTYHTVHDEIDRLDLENLTAIINLIQTAATPLIQGTQTPTRVVWSGK